MLDTSNRIKQRRNEHAASASTGLTTTANQVQRRSTRPTRNESTEVRKTDSKKTTVASTAREHQRPAWTQRAAELERTPEPSSLPETGRIGAGGKAPARGATRPAATATPGRSVGIMGKVGASTKPKPKAKTKTKVQLPAEIAKKIASATVKLSDMSNLTGAQRTEVLRQLADGGDAANRNLRSLIEDRGFPGFLHQVALKEQRNLLATIFRKVGSNLARPKQDAENQKDINALRTLLSNPAMGPSLSQQALRAALADPIQGVAASKYLEQNPAMGIKLLADATPDQAGNAFTKMSKPARVAVLKSLARGTGSAPQDALRKLGSAGYAGTGPKTEVRKKFGEAMKQLSPRDQAKVVRHVLSDRTGRGRTSPQANRARNLLADYLVSNDQALRKLTGNDRGQAIAMIRAHASDGIGAAQKFLPKLSKFEDRQPSLALDSAALAKIALGKIASMPGGYPHLKTPSKAQAFDATLRNLQKMTPATMEYFFQKGLPNREDLQKFLLRASPKAYGSGIDYTDADRTKLLGAVHRNLSKLSPKLRARFVAAMATNAVANNKGDLAAARKQIAKFMSPDTLRALANDAEGMQNYARVLLGATPDVGALKQLVKKTKDPVALAALVKAVRGAAAAEGKRIDAGTLGQAVLLGLTASAEKDDRSISFDGAHVAAYLKKNKNADLADAVGDLFLAIGDALRMSSTNVKNEFSARVKADFGPKP